MGSRLKVMKLLLQDGTLEGLLTVEDSSWNNGTFLSCPRENIANLLSQDEVNRYGVYLLLSDSKVYVGQSTQLKQRIEQHILGKDWWQRVIVLTTKTDSLNKSDIDYLESVLIEKSILCGTLDSDNKNKGNKQKVDKFRKAELDEFLDGALFILELIGVTVFSKNASSKQTTIISTSKQIPSDEVEIRSKSEARSFLKSNGIKLNTKYVSYAKLQEKTNRFWNNARVEETSNPWTLVLNNQIKKIIYVLEIPSDSFEFTEYPENGKICVRKDRQHYMDLNINARTFVDRKSSIDFSKFITNEIKY